LGTLLPQNPQIGRIDHPPGSKVHCYRNRVPIKFARREDVGSACVDIRPSPKTDVLVKITAFILPTSLVVAFVMRPAKAAEAIEMPLAWEVELSGRNKPSVRWEPRSPKGWGNLGVFPAHSNVLAVCAVVFTAKGIVQSSVTARHAMRPFVKFLDHLYYNTTRLATYMLRRPVACR